MSRKILTQSLPYGIVYNMIVICNQHQECEAEGCAHIIPHEYKNGDNDPCDGICIFFQFVPSVKYFSSILTHRNDKPRPKCEEIQEDFITLEDIEI